MQPNDLILAKGNCNAHLFAVRNCVFEKETFGRCVSLQNQIQNMASKGLVLNDYLPSSMIKYGVVTICPYVRFHSLFKFKFYILVSYAFNVHVSVDMPVPQCLYDVRGQLPWDRSLFPLWFPRIKLWLASLYGMPFDPKGLLFSPTHCIFRIWQKLFPPSK